VVVGIRRGRGCVGVVGHRTYSSTYQVSPSITRLPWPPASWPEVGFSIPGREQRCADATPR
jgi:hypothetical protein